MTDKQITHTCDATDCEQYYPEHTCCHCRNAEWYGLKEQLKAKEQECEELKKIIDEAKNSKLDLKSFLVGEAVQNEYEQQLDQLKAENDELKKIIERLDVPKHEVIDMDIALENERLKERIDNIRDFAKQGRDMFVEQGSFADWYKVAECMKNDFNFILYEIDEE